jgi:hypothetical protein
MEWVPLTDYENGINFNDRPRRLTSEEISYIVSHIPAPPSADSTAANVARQGVVDWIINNLKDVSITPSAIPALIKRIVDDHYRSLVAPGTPVGITAAEALGATTTQMTLNSVAPWEKILILPEQSNDVTNPKIIEIGRWIDKLMDSNASKIQHIPENRTQYLELDKSWKILSPDEDGNVSWERITAVTKHLPVGDMVKITTKSGRSVTATQSKSLLVWDGSKLVQTAGKDAKIGDLVPILSRLPDPETHRGKSPTPARTMGICVGLGLSKQPSLKLDTLMELVCGYSTEDLKLTYEYIKDHECEFTEFVKGRIGLMKRDRNDIMLDPIVSVEFVPATEYVYDLTVPTTTNFSLWNGLGVADTFHTSGSAKSASFGIEAMRDLIFARKNPKNESSTIYYKNKMSTFEEVLDSRQYIVGSVMSDFILREDGAKSLKYDIDNPDVLQRYWWHETAPLLLNKQIPPSTKVLRLFLNVPEMYKHKVSIADLAAVLEREVPPSCVTVYGPIGDGIIDVYPRPDIISDTLLNMTKNKTPIPRELAELTYLETIVMPQLGEIRVKGISGIKKLYPIVSPVWRMVILERKITNDDLVTEALRNVLGRYIGNSWFLFYNHDIMLTTGLIDQNLSALCQLAGCTIIGGDNNRLVISMPADRFRTSRGDIVLEVPQPQGPALKFRQLDSVFEFEKIMYREVNGSTIKETENGWNEETDDKVFELVPANDIRKVNDKFYRRIPNGNLYETNNITYELITNPRIKISELKPSEYVQFKVTNDKNARKNEIKRLTDERIDAARDLPEQQRKALIRNPVDVPRTRLMEAAEFVIAETDGSNLKELLSLPGIDKTRTTCNNMYTIAQTLGIEAARTFLIRALNNTISNTGSYIHPANITFIAEFITSRGEPYGATYTGISRQPGGHLSLATLERAGKVFTQSALHGRKEDIRNVSASVAVGARMAIGDGSFDIAQDITENGVQRTVINDDLFTALARDDNTKQVAAYRPVAQIPADDLTGGIDALKGITVGGAFDYTGPEDEANLITLFNPGEVIPEVGVTRPTQTAQQMQMVRRIQAAQPRTPPARHIEVPNELVDALNQIKIGVPILGEAITALEQVITAPVPIPEPKPIVSSGLILLEELTPVQTEMGVPDELTNLFARYADHLGLEGVEILPAPVQELPRVEIAALPDITGVALGGPLIEVRREQVRNLQPIDVKALQTALTK